jgi:hypothetical protein
MKMYSDESMTRIARAVTLFTVLTFISGPLMAQSQEKIYSLMILNFAKTINWPVTGTESKFIIGVLEYPPLVSELKMTSQNTKINGKLVEIRELTSPEESKGCQIVFLPAYKAKWLSRIIQHIPVQPTLIVSNKSDVARNGGGINFALVDGKLNFEINCKAIEKRGMKVSAALKSNGILIQ